MKKVVIAVLALVLLVNLNLYAQTQGLLSMRKDILGEANAIKAILTNTKDMIILSSLWDSCILTLTQLDAYFSLLGIFNTVKVKETTDAQVAYLSDWLKEVKKTNDLNIQSLSSAQAIEEVTMMHMEKLRGQYLKLNEIIDNELGKLVAIKKSLKMAPKKDKKK